VCGEGVEVEEEEEEEEKEGVVLGFLAYLLSKREKREFRRVPYLDRI